MGNPNEPHDPDRQPTESFAQPSDPTPPPTQEYAAGTPQAPAQAPTAGSTGWFSGSRRTGIVAGVAGLVIGGVVGGSIGWAVTGDGDHDRRDSAYSRQIASGEGGQHQHRGQAKGGQAERRTRGATIGTITAENGSSWTIAARNGRTVTVSIGQNTRFGTATMPQRQTDFAVGDRIVVLGKDNLGTIDATRVAKRATKPGSSTAPSSAVPGATTQPS